MNRLNIKTTLFIALLIFMTSFVSFAQDGQDYGTVIKSADEYYQKKDYYNAKAAYQLAAKLKPEESYPADKIQEIISLLKAEMAVRGAYDEFIETADEAFAVKDYSKSIEFYEKALALIAYEEHPNSRLEESRQLLEAAQLKESIYNEAISTADAHYAKQEYEQALSFYRDAANVDAEQKYPNEQILKITNLLKNQAQNQQAYEDAILQADQQLNYQKFTEALGQYELALNAKPSDTYATQQVAKMKDFIQKEKQYDAITAKADEFYIAQDLAAAKAEYQKAMDILPQKTYALNMMDKIDANMNKEVAKQQKLEEDYRKAIADADELFQAQKYQPAYSKYSKALDLKPNEKYPKEQLEEIDILLATGYVEIECFVFEGAKGLFDSRIQLKQGNKVLETAEIGTNGRHKLKLDLNQEYEIRFYKDNYVQKLFSVNTALPRDVNHNDIYTLDIDVELFPDCSADLSMLDKPLVEFKYIKEKRNFYYEEQRTSIVLNKVNTLKKDCEEIRQNEAQKEEYDDLIAKADKDLGNQKYSEAIENYSAALVILPNEEYPQQKITEINNILAESDKYQALIVSGDAKYNAKDYENALYDYYEAKNMKPNEEYPQQRITEIDGIINAQKELQAQYDAQVQRADELFAVDSLLISKEAYEAALEIKSEESYPQTQITLIDRKLGEQEELEERYQDAIANADKLFEKEKLNDAKSAYVIASQIKPDEMYPKYKIEDINTIEEQRRLRALNDNYTELITQADAELESKTYQAALELYARAGEVKPDESYPPAQIEKINGILAQLAANDQNYTNLITQADQEFEAKSYAPSFDNYKAALALKPAEEYPQQRMAEIEAIMKEMADAELAYQEAVKSGDEQFGLSKWTEAMGFYQKANELKPEETYPPQKIAEINGILGELADKDASYDAAIAQADQQFATEDWNNSKTSYQSALAIKAEEQYPKDQIVLIDGKLEELEALQAQYEALVAEADQLLSAQQLLDSKAKFQEASGLKPAETYPPQKIAEIDALLQDLADKDAAYDAAIAKADGEFEAEDWNTSKSSYESALAIKANEAYPTAQIGLIDAKLAEIAGALAALDAQYNALVKEADDLFTAQDLLNSKAKFQEAGTIKPEEIYPPQKIAEIDALLQDLADKDAAYDAAIAKADGEFEAEDWNTSKSSYQSALTIKANEAYPTAQIGLIDQKLAEIAGALAALDAQYNALIKEADDLFTAQDLLNSKTKFQEAGTIKPEETYPPQKIAEIDALLQDLADKDAAYNAAIARADAEFEAEDWNTSKSSYQSALAIKANEAYPTAQIGLIDAKLAEIAGALAALDAQYNALIKDGDDLFTAQDLLNSKAKFQEAGTIKPEETYPPQKIAEIDALLQDLADKDAAYDAAIAKADAEFEAEDWNTSKSSYESALAIKANEAYPTAQIGLIDAKLAEIAGALAALDAQYNALIKEGDDLFTAQDLLNSKAKFQEAATIKPEETYPPQKIAEIDALLQDLADKDAAYAAAIAKADAEFEAEDWNTSKSSYESALAIKANEAYPTAQIGLIDQKLAEIAGALAALDAQYNALIKEGDDLFTAQDLLNSKTKFQEAATIKPEETYPPQKIAEIDALLQDLADKDAAYALAIEKADAYFNEEEWNMSLTAYQGALEIKAEEQYPKDQIAIVESKLQEIADRQAQYDALIAQGDELFGAQTYVESKGKFQEALAIMANEQYPKDKIAEIDGLLQQLADQEALYAQFISMGDSKLAEQSYEAALTSYKDASELKPTEQYPKDKIAEIEAILLQIAEQDRLYTKAIQVADQNRDQESWEAALAKYQEASGIKANEPYPKDQIALINSKIQALADLQAAYDAAIAKADQEFEAKDWNTALTSYNGALELKANEVYPQTQIQEINRILKEIADNDAAYAQAISEADDFFKAKDWQSALTKYDLASSLKTEEQYPKDKITELNGILGELAAQQAQYDALIQEADQHFAGENYPLATTAYQSALEIKSEETYPKEQLTKIEEILAQLAAIQKQYDALIQEGDKQFMKQEWGLALPSYEQALELKPEEVYPQEQINKINEELLQIANTKAQYDALIAEADQMFEAKDYENALLKYEAALAVIATEQYPKDQMKAIRGILEELAAKNAEYEKIIAKADDLLLQQSFEKSKEQYQKALEVFAEKTYPQEQIVKIDDLIAKHTQFNTLVETGDEQFKNNEYEAALTTFNEARSILPEQTYPPQKITEIEQILAQIAATRAAYEAAVAKADGQLAAGEYEPAKESYQQALDQISTEVYPRQKMMEIDQILEDLARKRVQFDKIVAQANKAFDDQSYDVSLGKYLEALAIFPEEAYPQQRIDEINTILAQMANQKERYESLVAQGDEAFATEDYKTSIQMFNQALAIYAHETYPPQKIAEAEAALAKIQRELDVAYQKAIDAGDRSFRKKDWDPAKASYLEASEIKTEELYPKDKLAEINKILEEELLKQQKEYDRYIADGERFYSTKYYQEAILSFEKALGVFPFEKYPSEMIDKIFEMIKKTSMLTLLDGKMTLNKNNEEKFTFDPISYKDRSENYILLEVKRLDPEAQVKLYVNFGKGGAQNGGYSIPLKSNDGYHSYFVSIGKQVRWVNQDNNYISLLPEGGDVEVKLIKLSRNGI